ncbi:MAG TPA: hypothetical protein DCS93_36405 [Microscillaceae bacterium]|nr:hypothetical protein [Microscillaceae bacterium]
MYLKKHFEALGFSDFLLRVCLNFAFEVKIERFCGLLQYIFECIAKAMDEKITKNRAQKTRF